MSVTSRIRRHRGRPKLRITSRPLAVAGLAALAASVIAGCGGSSRSSGGGAPSGAASPSASVLAGGSCKSSSATKITFWAWVPGIARAVNEFNKTHSSICVTLENVGAGNPEYVKLSNALKAGSGAPDVAEVEFDELPSFEVQHKVVDLTKYGANNFKSSFVPWAWKEVSQGSGVYAMPSDSGPMGFYYNAKVLAKYHLSPPKTWAQFASEAAAVHKADPHAYLTNFAAADTQWIMSLMAQDNAFPFGYTGGSHVTINWTGPRQMAFASYWQSMLGKHELTAVADVAAEQFANMDKGRNVSWLSSAWGPSYFAPDAKSSVGDWRAAPLPQWTAGANVAANWGGSTYPVFTQSKHPAQAAQFSEWLCANQASWNIVKTPPSSLFPTYVPLLNDPSFKHLKYPPSGSSSPNVVFTGAAPKVTTVQWPPFMTYALTQAATTFAGVANGKETLQQAFKTFQGQLVKYAKQQGFSVST
ncbi:MAG: extracellular solute-binding protein [Actinobacteria bacterium]|nr:extracellular solute-binding protein [Actinomycetota bacterium]